jgi:hypothetical protein
MWYINQSYKNNCYKRGWILEKGEERFFFLWNNKRQLSLQKNKGIRPLIRVRDIRKTCWSRAKKMNDKKIGKLTYSNEVVHVHGYHLRQEKNGKWERTSVCQKKKKSWSELKKSWGFMWDCWKKLVCVFLTKKSHKIH